jgi:hypothetical protein
MGMNPSLSSAIANVTVYQILAEPVTSSVDSNLEVGISPTHCVYLGRRGDTMEHFV